MSNPALSIFAGSDKADGPAAMHTGGLYGLFSRYLAERPFPQSLALQTFLSFFVSFFLSFVMGQTNKNQSERLNCPESPGARMIIAAVLRRASPYYSGSRGVWAGYSGCFEARASLL